MSTLDVPRLHFTGRFQADTSTINNDVRHYKNDAFRPEFQAPMVGYGQGLDAGSGEDQRTNGYWNPEGSGAWRLLGCTITGAVGPDGPVAAGDAVLGMRLTGTDSRVAAKLVDLDPQQQLVSQIWGLEVRILDGEGRALVQGHFKVAPFIDLWKKQQISQNFDQTLAAVYQSQLWDVRWGDLARAPLLAALKAATAPGRLAIRMNVFGFDRDPNAADYMTGALIGSLGPVRGDEPVSFTLGRQLIPTLKGPIPILPAQGVNTCTAVVHADRQVVTIDVGNSLPIVTASGDLLPMGELSLAVCTDVNAEEGGFVPSEGLVILGEIPYTSDGFSATTAGVVDLSIADNTAAQALIPDHPLAVVQKLGSKGYRILVRETDGGLAIRPEPLVHRLNPGEARSVTVFATRYGAPCATELQLGLVPSDQQIIGGAGTGANLNASTWPIPAVALPAEAIRFPGSVHEKRPVRVPASGRADLTIRAAASGPGCPRGYLDGQIYAIQLSTVEAGRTISPWCFLSVLCWDRLARDPARPTWYRDIEPILSQYGNLYPIMSRAWINLGDYDQVVSVTRLLRLALSLPIEDPNHMPVSRDLSDAKRRMILRWLDDPVRGKPSDRPKPRAPRYVQPPPKGTPTPARDPAGKFDFAAQVAASRDRGGEG